MRHYIAYIDVLGTKSSAENENFEQYLRLLTNFQNGLINILHHLREGQGRVHFFSECAFIECSNLDSLINSLVDLRQNLFDAEIFIRGAIIVGKLGAINGSESENFVQEYYEDEAILNHYKTLKKSIKDYSFNVRGTLFYSLDIAKLVHMESTLKGASIIVDSEVIKNKKYTNKKFVQSLYIADIRKHQPILFFDLIYDRIYISNSLINKILRNYYLANLSDFSYGRYYVSMLISMINSSNFSKAYYDETKGEFHKGLDNFTSIIYLKKQLFELYDTAQGLDFVYLALINKVYIDIDHCNSTTRVLVKLLTNKNKHLSRHLNKLAKIPKEILSPKAQRYLIKDLSLVHITKQ